MEFMHSEYKTLTGYMKVKSSEVAQSCRTLCDPMDCSPPGSSSMGFSRQEHWSGLPRPSPGIEPGSPALQADTLPSEPPGKPSMDMSLSKRWEVVEATEAWSAAIHGVTRSRT